MDDRRFDELTRILATRSTRRSLLKAAVGSLTGVGAAALGVRVADGRGRTVPICHRIGSRGNRYLYMLVSPAKACSHAKHGDAIGVDLNTNPNHCGTCGTKCSDGNLCTLDLCVGGQCVYPPAVSCAPCHLCNPATGICEPQCGPCEQCDTGSNTCVAIPECCQSDIDCDDNNPCTLDSCDTQTNTCIHTPIPDCCVTHQDCDDGDPCTIDYCENNVCGYAPIDDCCQNDADCPDPPEICLEAYCNPSTNTCGSNLIPGCCLDDAECPACQYCDESSTTCIGDDSLDGQFCNFSEDTICCAGICEPIVISGCKPI